VSITGAMTVLYQDVSRKDNNIMKKKQKITGSSIKTDWNFVMNLICIGLIGITMCMIGKYVNIQAERIDLLELDHIIPASHHHHDEDDVKPGVTWKGKVDE